MAGIRELIGDDEAVRACLREAVERRDGMEFVSADVSGPRLTVVVRSRVEDGDAETREVLYGVKPEPEFEDGVPTGAERLRWRYLGPVDG